MKSVHNTIRLAKDRTVLYRNVTYKMFVLRPRLIDQLLKIVYEEGIEDWDNPFKHNFHPNNGHVEGELVHNIEILLDSSLQNELFKSWNL